MLCQYDLDPDAFPQLLIGNLKTQSLHVQAQAAEAYMKSIRDQQAAQERYNNYVLCKQPEARMESLTLQLRND